MNIFQKQTLVWGGIGAIAFTFIANSVKADTQVQDHYKNIIYKTPSQVEVCYDRQVSGDKTGDAIKGAIIGGILGNQNSTASGNICRTETRYTEQLH